LENKSLISVIMPFKNTAAFIGDCIQSIIDQTETNWELIAIDDSSTDESRNIVSAFQKQDARIRVYTNDGLGIVSGLQTAYKHAIGDFITRMDSDDLMPLERLSIHKKTLEQNGLGHLVTAKVSFFSDEPIGAGYQQYENWLNRVCEQQLHWDEIFKECVIPSPCWMMYRLDFEKCGGFSGSDFPEDYDLTFRIWEQNMKVIGCRETLLYWREHPERTSNTDDRLKDNYFSDLKIKYFLKNCYSNRALVLWGAGNRGKELAKILLEKKIPFDWITANPSKVKKTILGIELKNFQTFNLNKDQQHIISFADTKGQEEIKTLMLKQGKTLNEGYFFFA
jgi:glycosyltransferase involved in cell wall biosynthesis